MAIRRAAELRERILDGMRRLLAERRFDELNVADVLTEAKVSRASFYFYFPSKQAVLADLVRAAVGEGHGAAAPFVDPDGEGLRAGIRDGARLWRENAGVLTAVVDAWATDDDLRALWLAQMDTFTDAAAARIAADPRALAYLGDRDVRAVAAGLTWTGERLYYLAASGVPPFDDEQVLIDVLTHAWTSILYGESGGVR
ncbi:TetR/AcrR family transcriptional regulator [Cryptosporangium phraense]|uniref:TetR/AcrR family transcriptional regulator n=1 Tax=Cryptosporangium phraense TaxID=2593070 RepID=A0A545ASV5_9ACTN|nr:TetR/AcrR family transcriptional regulator [Cryptosporangium phraense]TQS44408.1 TetR/AcrR family transcriptional regulator [Cryptosporangium phraense]